MLLWPKNILIWVSENKDFDAEFESVEIVVKQVYRKKTFVHSTDGKKYIIFYTFMIITFYGNFFTTFSSDSKSASSSAYIWHPYLNYLGKNLKPNAHKTAQNN